MSDFHSSEGVKVATLPTGALLVDSETHINAKAVRSLREYFAQDYPDLVEARARWQHQEDARLGRWRWPENPDYVCYEHDGGVFILDEKSGRQMLMQRGHDIDGAGEYNAAATAYFAAHPASKPWHDAKCGDYWYLEPFDIVYGCVGNEPDLWFTRSNVYDQVEKLDLTDPRITAGRRVWPEVTS